MTKYLRKERDLLGGEARKSEEVREKREKREKERIEKKENGMMQWIS